MLHAVGDFFLSVWLWSVTWGIYHAPLAALFLTLLFRYIGSMRWLPASALSACANAWSFAVYTFLIVGVLIKLLQYEHTPITPTSFASNNTLMVGIYLTIVYVLLQALFFLMVRRYCALSFAKMIFLSLIANLAAAACIYAFAPVL